MSFFNPHQPAFSCSESTMETQDHCVRIKLKLLKVKFSTLICSKLKIKSSEHQWRCFDVFIINFQQISHIVLVFLLLNLNKETCDKGYSNKFLDLKLVQMKVVNIKFSFRKHRILLKKKKKIKFYKQKWRGLIP